MRYAPHILYKKTSVVLRNEYNEIVESTTTWEEIGECRCDDNTTAYFETANGCIYIPKYHIVCDRCNISEGDEVKVLRRDGTYRGGGKVFNSPKCNYLNYMSIYV